MIIPLDLSLATTRYLSTTAVPSLVSVIVFRASWRLDEAGHLEPCETHRPPDFRDTTYPDTGEVLKESDLVACKPRADLVFIVPQAVNERGEAAAVFRVAINTADGETALIAQGPSTLYRNRIGRVRRSEATKTESVPLRFSCAFGGQSAPENGEGADCDHRNPIGRGFAVAAGKAAEEPAPQVWLEREPFDPAKGMQNVPVALTPVGRSWLPRRTYAGVYDDQWKETRLPFLPADFDERFNNCAHSRLQISHDAAIAPISITGMSRSPIRFCLGPERLLLLLDIDRPQDPPVVLPIDTVLVSPSTGRIDTIWRVAGPPNWMEARLAYRMVEKGDGHA